STLSPREAAVLAHAKPAKLPPTMMMSYRRKSHPRRCERRDSIGFCGRLKGGLRPLSSQHIDKKGASRAPFVTRKLLALGLLLGRWLLIRFGQRRAELPRVAVGVRNHPKAITPELIRRRHRDLRARLCRLGHRAVDILRISKPQVHRHRRAAQAV